MKRAPKLPDNADIPAIGKVTRANTTQVNENIEHFQRIAKGEERALPLKEYFTGLSNNLNGTRRFLSRGGYLAPAVMFDHDGSAYFVSDPTGYSNSALIASDVSGLGYQLDVEKVQRSVLVDANIPITNKPVFRVDGRDLAFISKPSTLEELARLDLLRWMTPAIWSPEHARTVLADAEVKQVTFDLPSPEIVAAHRPNRYSHQLWVGRFADQLRFSIKSNGNLPGIYLLEKTQ